MAPSCRATPEAAERVLALAEGKAEVVYHPQAFLSDGHFAGTDEQRAAALVEAANDPAFDAVWFARGGYGSNRIVERVLPQLGPVAREKAWMGYSDSGFLFAGLYGAGFRNIFHGPLAQDVMRPGGEAATTRALDWLSARAPEALEPSLRPGEKAAAFNLTVFSHLVGTALQPDLAGHVLMLEDVDEHMYRVDRAMFHVTSNARVREVAGIRLGRVSAVPPNNPDFVRTEEDVVQDWCARAGIAYLGRADIGHDPDNKVVPFGGI